MSAITLQDEVVHYEVLGRGRGVLFLHGWLGSWRYWIPAMQSVSSRYRAYALDLWGYGDTGRRGKRYMLADQADLVAAFLDQLGVAKIAIVGHGLGGAVALRFLNQNPDRVARLMVINTPIYGELLHPRLQTVTATADLATLLGARGDDLAPVTSELGKMDMDAVIMGASNFANSDFRDTLLQATVPSLLVHGAEDPVIPDAQYDWLENNISGEEAVHYLSVEDARHFPMLEDKAKFNRLLVDFLETEGNLKALTLKEEWKRRMR